MEGQQPHQQGQQDESAAAVTRRWTCEACGCNTNRSSDRACTICGTGSAGLAGVRRHPGGMGYGAARVGWFSRGLSRQRAVNDELPGEEEDLWDNVVDGVEIAGADDAESAIESLAMEVSGMARNRFESSRQRFLDAARAFSQSTREAQAVDATELLRIAGENAPSYQPKWANPGMLCGRGRSTNGIEVGDGERQNLAHLPPGAGEGRTIRADEPLPRCESFSPFNMAIPSDAEMQNRASRRAYGFRVAFDHPACAAGENMGGCYLVGVTTTAFTHYGEHNGLQQSPFFWGIEDSGQKYEGSRYNQARGNSRRAPSNAAIELSDQEIALNSANVLFGSREVVTVVCDFETRSLTFWRDEALLGTLVSNLPRSGNLYPVAVPFNCGVTVAITAVDNDPLPLLRTFASDWHNIQRQKDDQVRECLAAERSMLVAGGFPTPQLLDVLKLIFAMYLDSREDEELHELPSLSYTRAARLWYRCGLKLSCLDEALRKSGSKEASFGDFIAVVERILHDDEKFVRTRIGDESASTCEVGDKVELVEGYAKYGDASGGPLQPGDRGTVLELQEGPNGDRRSIRVIHDGRRWWYQPQAVVSERSGLIESPGVWFLKGVLRLHGFDHTTLEALDGRPLSPSWWRVGDVVMPRKWYNEDEESRPTCTASLIGRIVPDITSPSTALTGHGRESPNVSVEFVGRAFADAVGVKVSSDAAATATAMVESRPVRASKLVHATLLHDSRRTSIANSSDDEWLLCDDAAKKPSSIKAMDVGESMLSELASVARLERAGTETVTKECRKNSDALAALFFAGLPDSVLSAIDTVEKQLASLEPREDLVEKICSTGALVIVVADQLYSEAAKVVAGNTLEIRDSNDPPSQIMQRVSESDQFNAARMIQMQEALRRRDFPRDDQRGYDRSILPSIQRRSMLLSVVSRAGGGRRGNGVNLNDAIERSIAREFHLSNIAPSIGSGRDAQPSFFGGHGESIHDTAWEDAAAAYAEAERPSALEEQTDAGARDSSASTESSSVLRGEACTRRPVASYFGFVRKLINGGILLNSLEWVDAIMNSQEKKTPMTSLQRSYSSIIRLATDEEGMSLLLLAISLGSSTEILSRLIACGASVGPDELKKAAETNQPKVLELLLQQTSYVDGMIDVAICSSDVAAVLIAAKNRQDELDKKMRDQAGSFIVQLLRKLLRILLASRQNHCQQIMACSKALSEILIGNVLLGALQRAQKSSSGINADDEDAVRESVDRSGRFPVEDSASDPRFSPRGLLGILPKAVVREALFTDFGDILSFFRVVEDYLCSKDLNDAASGLTFLTMILEQFPQLSSCSEIDRFGIEELVSHHDSLASKRIAEILSKKSANNPQGSIPSSSELPRMDVGGMLSNCVERGIVLCPKKHTAILHITRHSSFRCDLCGSGVERGRPMHGCRDCDWDACEVCMDKAESGLVKNSAIRELAATCLRLLSEVSDDSDEALQSVVQQMRVYDNATELSSLSLKLLNRDLDAVVEVGNILRDPGRVTIHQFLTTILPSLHAALVGRTSGDALVSGFGSRHRNKKAKVVGDRMDVGLEGVDVRFDFCREVVRYMVLDNQETAESEIGGRVEMRRLSQPRDDSDELNNSEQDGQDLEREFMLSSIGSSELLRRLHQVLALYEMVPVLTCSEKKIDSTPSGKGGELHALTKSIELCLSASAFARDEESDGQLRLVLNAEPLVALWDLELHILRTQKPQDPYYLKYCRGLEEDMAIIVERPSSKAGSAWRVGRVVNYNEKSGYHTIRMGRYSVETMPPVVRFGPGHLDGLRSLQFDGPECYLMLAARQYYVLERGGGSARRARDACSDAIPSQMTQRGEPSDFLRDSVGSRVESCCHEDGEWKPYTLVAVASDLPDSCTLVDDDGVVLLAVSLSQIRHPASLGDESNRGSRRARDERGSVVRAAYPFFARQQLDSTRNVAQTNLSDSRTLKRSWSALAVVESMRPIDLNVSSSEQRLESLPPGGFSLNCLLNNHETHLVADPSSVEIPPSLIVKFSTHEKLPGLDLSSHSGRTLINALKELYRRQDKQREWPPGDKCELFFSIAVCSSDSRLGAKVNASPICSLNAAIAALPSTDMQADLNETSWPIPTENRSRKLSARSVNSDDDDGHGRLCEGFNELCIQCMEVISLLAECSEDSSGLKEKTSEPGFANPSLSKKLVEQLDDPVAVVGKALPDWCLSGPTFAPRAFSYKARRMLLDRVAFGVSRSALKQQEAKVNVGKLKQRMGALRARAVELVGEAFSGGAEDPTALQLQADELYGMEEALAARVRAAFRAVKWQEHALQVAKAAVRRDKLLSDASAIMERYAKDSRVCRRRLEVRFEGESGFDAASGDEAGVTRGFYADVAEALLTSDNVAGVFCALSCSFVPSVASLDKQQQMEPNDIQREATKLPLWIPDMDSSGQVVLPTPRADERSGLGVFPRPLPHYHPQISDVLQRFRFMGRLFAAAMRDCFMFPLPLSTSFLKLVQHCGSSTVSKSSLSREVFTSGDLPRPGFLGGEVYAAEHYICVPLHRLETADPPLPKAELHHRFKEIATDKNFARVAFGKSYDCSFEDYFQHRTFVDPLDPGQGEDAAPLCPEGSKKTVTIFNVREWVALSKHFILNEGVVAQAVAFRNGVEDFFSADYLRLFTPSELQRDVCGAGDNVENWDEGAVRKLFKLDGGKSAAEAIVAVASIGGPGGATLSRRFGPSSPTIAFLVQALVEASPKLRRQFLSFVTSVPIVTPGRIEVVPMVSPSGEFLPMQDPSCLPRANTCSRRLYLPKFETFESFSQVLWAVVREESKFKGFYEWRGN